MIINCGCKHIYQDCEHGFGKRVHNSCKLLASRSGRGWRCTVCGNKKPAVSKIEVKEEQE